MMTINDKFRPIFITPLGSGNLATSLLRADVVAQMF